MNGTLLRNGEHIMNTFIFGDKLIFKVTSLVIGPDTTWENIKSKNTETIQTRIPSKMAKPSQSSH